MRANRAVDHSIGQYVVNGARTNLAEGFFSQLKRSVDGTHHHVSRVHLARYLAQFDFLLALPGRRLDPDARTDRARRRTTPHLQATDRALGEV